MADRKLENWIKKNRLAFDGDQPPDAVWEGIEKRLPVRKVGYNWLWRAAAVLFFLSSAYLYFDRPTPLNLTAKRESVFNDFSDVEQFYFQIIHEKRELIYDYDSLDKPLEVDFEQDLQKLDAMYQVLKDELNNNPSRKVIDALILNLLVRIDVLNKKIEDLEGVTNHNRTQRKRFNS